MRTFAHLLSLVLVGGVLGGGVFAEFVKEPCDEKKDEVAGGINNPLTCGSTSCPENVKTEATIVRPENLRVKGTMFIPSGGIEKIDINMAEYDTDYLMNKRQMVPNVNPENAIDPIHITADGKWIFYRDGGKGYLIDTTGNGKTQATPHSVNGCIWRGKGGTDTLWIVYQNSSKDVFARAFDVSNGTPVRADGGEDWKLVENSGTRKSDWMAAGTDYVCLQERLDGAQYTRGYIYKIPGEGAIATVNDRYPFAELYPANCNFTVDMTGTMLAGNFAHGYQDCLPDNHKGPTLTWLEEFAGDPKDWITEHTVSLNWAPTDYEGKDLRMGTNGDAVFDHWYWTNDSSYLVCSRLEDHPSIAVYGNWLVNWKTNEWTKLPTYPNVTSKQFAVHISGPRNVKAEKYAPIVHRTRRDGAHALNVWRDLLGRKTNSGSNISAKGIQIDNAGTKVNNVDKTGKR